MKIALVCGHFLPDFGYVEVHLARAYARLGHEVTVFTSTSVPQYIRSTHPHPFKAGEHHHDGIRIIRFSPDFALGQMVRVKGLKSRIEMYKPELLIVTGLGKLFPIPLLKAANHSCRISVLLGDNTDNKKIYGNSIHRRIKRGVNTLKTIMTQRLLKNKAYRLAVQNADDLFAYTPETSEIVAKYIPKQLFPLLKTKIRHISLGFDETVYYFDPAERTEKRRSLGLSEDDVLIVTSTRVTQNKRLEDVIQAIRLNQNVKYALIGFMGDSFENRLKERINRYGLHHRVFCFPFLQADEIRKFYNAADLGIWHHPTISTVEAMGTGLYVLMEKRKKAAHLLSCPESGAFFKADAAAHAIETAISASPRPLHTRMKMAEKQKKLFCWMAIADTILSERA